LWLTALLVLGSCLARADELQWYTVEILVFRLQDESGLYLERWPMNPGLPDAALARSLVAGTRAEPAQDNAPADGDAFVLLGNDQFSLEGVASALRRSGAYQPLLHVAWRQPGFAQAEAITVRLHSQLRNPYRTDETAVLRQAQGYGGFTTEQAPVLNRPSAVLDGTIRLRRARYLHVDADLVYYRPPAIAQGIGSAPEPSLFRLTESRRMRSSELHFLDHPMFGVLVEVRRHERTQPSDSASVSE
jgi:hypothetical protein